MSKSTLKTALLKWHRRSGLIIAPIMVMLVVTGIAINHSEEFGWSHKPVHSPIIAALYGIKTAPISQGFYAQTAWFTQLDEAVYRDQQRFGDCPSALKGVLVRQQDMALLCDDVLLLLTPTGELIEKFTQLPAIAQQIGLHAGNNQIVLRALPPLVEHTSTDEQTSISGQPLDAQPLATQPLATQPLSTQQAWLLDEDLGEWQEHAANNVEWSQAQALPAALTQALNHQRAIPGITQERVLLDLHSGRLFGKVGVLIVDVGALLLLALAASGAYSVWLRRRRKTK